MSRITIMDISRANFGLSKVLLRRIPRDRALGGRGVQESWLVPLLLPSSRLMHPMRKKSSNPVK